MSEKRPRGLDAVRQRQQKRRALESSSSLVANDGLKPVPLASKSLTANIELKHGPSFAKPAEKQRRDPVPMAARAAFPKSTSSSINTSISSITSTTASSSVIPTTTRVSLPTNPFRIFGNSPTSSKLSHQKPPKPTNPFSNSSNSNSVSIWSNFCGGKSNPFELLHPALGSNSNPVDLSSSSRASRNSYAYAIGDDHEYDDDDDNDDDEEEEEEEEEEEPVARKTRRLEEVPSSFEGLFSVATEMKEPGNVDTTLNRDLNEDELMKSAGIVELKDTDVDVLGSSGLSLDTFSKKPKQSIDVELFTTSVSPPKDWGLKSRITLISPTPFTSLTLSSPQSDLGSIVDFLATPSTSTILASLYHFRFPPSAPPPSHRALLSKIADKLFSNVSLKTYEDTEFEHYKSRRTDWKSAFFGFYNALRSNHLPWGWGIQFAGKYSVLFLAKGRAGNGEIEAVVSKSDQALRDVLTSEDIRFSQVPHPTTSKYDKTSFSTLILKGPNHVHGLFEYLLNLTISDNPKNLNVDLPVLVSERPFVNAALIKAQVRDEGTVAGVLSAHTSQKTMKTLHKVTISGTMVPNLLGNLLTHLSATQDFSVYLKPWEETKGISLSTTTSGAANDDEESTDVPRHPHRSEAEIVEAIEAGEEEATDSLEKKKRTRRFRTVNVLHVEGGVFKWGESED